MTSVLRLVAKAIFLLTGAAALTVLWQHRWPLGWVGGIFMASLLSFLAVLIHEFAHAGAARWFGGQVRKIVVLPFELTLTPCQIRFVGSVGYGDLGGYVEYDLKGTNLRAKQASIAIAGPAANIVTAVIAGFLAAALDSGTQGHRFATAAAGNIHTQISGGPQTVGNAQAATNNAAVKFPDARTVAAVLANYRAPIDYGEPIPPVLAAAFMLLSLGIGVGNLIPFKGSDGLQLWYFLHVGVVARKLRSTPY